MCCKTDDTLAYLCNILHLRGQNFEADARLRVTEPSFVPQARRGQRIRCPMVINIVKVDSTTLEGRGSLKMLFCAETKALVADGLFSHRKGGHEG